MLRLTVILLFLFFELLHSQFIIPERIIPEKLTVYFTTKKIDGLRKPILHLRCPGASNNFFWVSDLHTNQICSKDTLFIDVQGYDFINHSKYIDTDSLLSFPAIKFSKKDIVISKKFLENNKTKIVLIKLNRQFNKFEIKRDNRIINFKSVSVNNIEIPQHPLFDFNKVILFPSNCYRLYASGYSDSTETLLNDLKSFGKQAGLILANEIYPQIPIGFNDSNVYFVVPDSMRYKKHLGYLPNYPKAPVSMVPITDFGDGL